MAETVTCGICLKSVDPESPAAHSCVKCSAPYHYVCWVYNDRLCARYGCETVNVEDEEQKLLKSTGGMFGEFPAQVVIYVLGALLALAFLMFTCRDARSDRNEEGGKKVKTSNRMVEEPCF